MCRAVPGAGERPAWVSVDSGLGAPVGCCSGGERAVGEPPEPTGKLPRSPPVVVEEAGLPAPLVSALHLLCAGRGALRPAGPRDGVCSGKQAGLALAVSLEVTRDFPEQAQGRLAGRCPLFWSPPLWV